MPLADNRSRGRNWCFTINNPTAVDDPRDWQNRGATYCVWQLEKGLNNTEHYQGYVQFRTAQRLTAVKAINTRAHWEQARGSAEENTNYCTKPEGRVEGPFEYGIPKTQGARTDLAEAAHKVWDGTMTMNELRDSDPHLYCQYGRAIERGKLACLPDRHWPCQGVVYWGPSGIGKSKLCEQKYPDAYWKSDSTKWWDNYTGQRVVIWDDFDPTTIPYKYLLRVVDRYPMQVEYKGGYVSLQADTIVFTSVADPATWYPEQNTNYNLAQLMRRLNEIHHVLVPPVSPIQESMDQAIQDGVGDVMECPINTGYLDLECSEVLSASISERSVLDDQVPEMP